MFKFIGSPHSHIETPLSGSTPDSFVKKAIDLGREYFSYTDHNYMSGIFKVYGMASKKKLKYVAGLEVYFKDKNCPLIKGAESARSNYFKITLHSTNQESFQKMGELSSKKRPNKIVLNGEEYGLWDWSDLELAAQAGCLACSSEINDMVGKHILLNSPKVAMEYYRKLKTLFGDNYYLCLVGNKFDKYHVTAVDVTFEDDTKTWFLNSDYVSTFKSKKVKAIELFDEPERHNHIVTGSRNGVIFNYKNYVKKVDLIQGNIPIENGDLQLKVNRFLLLLSQREKVPLLYSDYSYYASAGDKVVQDVRLYSENKKEYVQRHMQSSEEANTYMLDVLGLSQDQIDIISQNQAEWLAKFDGFKLKYDIRLPAVDNNEDPMKVVSRMIKETGRMKWDDPEYVARLKREVDVIANNGVVNLLPYFFPIRDVLNEYKKENLLIGAGRGSAAGSLLLYVIGITHVNPIRFKLSFERFLSLTRVKSGSYPDVDTDLPSRDLLVGKDRHSGFLYGKWGDKASQISTRTLLRLKSSITDVNRFFNKGKVEPYIKTLTKNLPSAPQGISDLDFVSGYEDSDGNHTAGLLETSEDLQDYVESRPEQWEIVQKCLGISRQVSAHASAFVISDSSIKSTVPLFNDEFTQYEAKAVESAGMIKYDYLVVKQLEDIQLAMKLVNKRSGIENIPNYHIAHNGQILDIMDLPDDDEVFKSVWDGETASIFQLHTAGMAAYCRKIKPKNIEDISTILALYRPGPLDFIDEKTGRNMAEEYVELRFGRSKPAIREMVDLLPETYGVMVYQENVSYVSVALGGMSPDDAEELRRVFSKKDKKKSLEMKPLFMKGAVEKLGQEKAETIWNQMETFSRYGFNLSHSICYAMMSYQSMFLKHHYPLEWWAAVLSNADEGEISTTLFKHVKDLIIAPDINISGSNMTIDYEKGKIRAKLGVLKGAGDKSIGPIVANAPYVDIKDFVKKEVAGPAFTKRLIHVGAMDSLFPPKYNLLQKMQDYEDAIVENKRENLLKAGGKPKPIKKGEIDPLYLTLSPIKDFQLKKAIFPTMPSNLSELFVKYSSKKNEGSDDYKVYSNSHGKTNKFWNGDYLKRFEAVKILNANMYYCCAAYIVDFKEFTYSGGTKKALKVFIDVDGHIMEKVMWADYNTGKLIYPKDMKKGSVCLVFMSRRATKEGASESSPSSISEIVLESI